ncbi:MAG: hypothetical protein CML56_00920 [Rhodobacteraceae bacterium]|nr:hypothetical protein [Paracoccaceae bacterium]
MFIFGVALGIIASFSFLAIMMKAMPPNPPDDIITGQNWFITGLGVVEITKVLNSGSFTEFGYGVNIQYIMSNGKYGHCTAKSLKEHGRIVPKPLTSKSDLGASISSKKFAKNRQNNITYTYDKNGKTRIINAVYRDIN